jgi:hypothetical protein
VAGLAREIQCSFESSLYSRSQTAATYTRRRRTSFCSTVSGSTVSASQLEATSLVTPMTNVVTTCQDPPPSEKKKRLLINIRGRDRLPGEAPTKACNVSRIHDERQQQLFNFFLICTSRSPAPPHRHKTP